MLKKWFLICWIILILSLLGVIGYFYPWGGESQLLRETNIYTHTPISQTNTNSLIGEKTIREIQTEKSSPKASASGMVFQKPNTEWVSRYVTLNDGRTFHYVFGEGDPKEVMIKLEDLDGYMRQSGYIDDKTVRPRTEKLLAEFLLNPMLPIALNKCGFLMSPNAGTSDSDTWELGLPDTLFNTDFSMEGMLTIDPITGRKVIDDNKFNFLGNAVGKIHDHWPINFHNQADPLQNQCLEGEEITRMDELFRQYHAVQESWYNGSPENRKEICKFLDLHYENCN
mgnify:CR=1 FL=1